MKGVIDTTELTDKQRQFIELRRAGKPYSEIAKQLGISKGTCSKWNTKFQSEINFEDYAEEAYAERMGTKAVEKEKQNKITSTDFTELELVNALIKSRKQSLQECISRRDVYVKAGVRLLSDEQLKRFVETGEPVEFSPTSEEEELYLETILDIKFIRSTIAYLEKCRDEIIEKERSRIAATHNTSSAPILNLYRRIITYGSHMIEFPERDKLKNSHSKKTRLTQSTSGNTLRYTYESNGKYEDLQLTFIVPNPETIDATDRTNEKVLEFVIEELTAHISNGELKKDFFSFPISKLVDKGIYKNTKTAAESLPKILNSFIDIRMNGTWRQKVGKDKKKTLPIGDKERATGTHLFQSWRSDENGNYTIYPGDDIPWAFVFRFFTILPDYYYALPQGAARLLLCIFLQARQHTRDIKDKGCFTLSMRQVHDFMRLPLEKNTTNNTVQIKNAILNAVEQIESVQGTTYENQDLAIEVIPPSDCCLITDYLNNGFLRVNLSGKYAEHFARLQEQSTKKAEERKQRQKRIEDQAKAKALANKIEREATAEATGKS